jgi:hypothetical protein
MSQARNLITKVTPEELLFGTGLFLPEAMQNQGSREKNQHKHRRIAYPLPVHSTHTIRCVLFGFFFQH